MACCWFLKILLRVTKDHVNPKRLWHILQFSHFSPRGRAAAKLACGTSFFAIIFESDQHYGEICANCLKKKKKSLQLSYLQYCHANIQLNKTRGISGEDFANSYLLTPLHRARLLTGGPVVNTANEVWKHRFFFLKAMILTRQKRGKKRQWVI